MDREYLDFRHFHFWTEQGVFSVTRMKENIRYVVEISMDVPRRRDIVSDEWSFPDMVTILRLNLFDFRGL